MNPPTQPLALSAAYLSLLQARQSAQKPADSTAASAGNETPRPTPGAAGRGRLIDILA
jgi:hypothetical protein